MEHPVLHYYQAQVKMVVMMSISLISKHLVECTSTYVISRAPIGVKNDLTIANFRPDREIKNNSGSSNPGSPVFFGRSASFLERTRF